LAAKVVQLARSDITACVSKR